MSHITYIIHHKSNVTYHTKTTTNLLSWLWHSHHARMMVLLMLLMLMLLLMLLLI